MAEPVIHTDWTGRLIRQVDGRWTPIGDPIPADPETFDADRLNHDRTDWHHFPRSLNIEPGDRLVVSEAAVIDLIDECGPNHFAVTELAAFYGRSVGELLDHRQVWSARLATA